ncbi:MAG: NifB/NifX family molybdenum-iron cluster-binding protein [Limnochordia bacterium]|nr:NifB/NifX family molybdenum-iron cluster-binding protein [Limnochordia bacterium]
MKIAVSSQGKDMTAAVDPRFGRCRYFIIYSDEDGSFEVVENAGVEASGGAGVRAAELLSDHGVDVLLTGTIGPNAQQGLRAAEIAVYTQAEGTVQGAISAYNEGKLKLTLEPNVGSHFGRRGRD